MPAPSVLADTDCLLYMSQEEGREALYYAIMDHLQAKIQTARRWVAAHEQSCRGDLSPELLARHDAEQRYLTAVDLVSPTMRGPS